MLIAEELEVDVDKVAIEHSPPDDKLYVNPLVGYQLTGASTAIRGTCVPLRQAGATARVMLVTAAAQRWRVDPATCRAQSGAVVHVPTGRRLGYGGLVDTAAKLPVPDRVALKEPRDFNLIGTPHRRLDSPGKVDGSAQFGIDVPLPGMKFAVVAASPTFGGKLVSVDETKAMAVRGVSQVVRLDDAVAIVATNIWVAKQGLAAASPRWAAGPNASLSTADIVEQLARASERPGAVARREGDAAKAIAGASRQIDAIYEQPFLAHATMEPMNCTVQLSMDACDIWVGTQIPGITQAVVMKVTGLKREQVRIHNQLLGGGFGRRLEFDGTVRAVQIAQHVCGPVQVIWTREEDIEHDMYRPYYYDRISAGVDASSATRLRSTACPIASSRSGRRVLGSRTRASGLPAAGSRRLYVPLCPPQLEAAGSHEQAAQGGVTMNATVADADVRRFSEELTEHVHVARIREDVKGGRRIGVLATPTFLYVNGHLLRRFLRDCTFQTHGPRRARRSGFSIKRN